MQRRTVLRSAVKLVYATPLVVATVRITESHAGASQPCDAGCPACEECLFTEDRCVPIPGCVTCDAGCGPCEECVLERCVPIDNCIP